MSSAEKETIYVDIDDEITTIVDKVKASDRKIVALVLPKRASVLHSIVNMKLLKRRADGVGKRVVLITSEKSLLPIAGAVGVHTAKTLQSKPGVPPPPEIPESGEDEVLESEPSEDLDKSKSVGELAGSKDEAETIDIDDEEGAAAGAGAAELDKEKSKPKMPKIKIPNFNSFRIRLFAGIGALILLIIFLVFATKVLPKAKIIVKANTSTVAVNPTFTLDSTAKAVDVAAGVAPAELKEFKKSDSQQVTASGQKDVGTKATGTVTMSIACSDVSGSAPTIPAGSAVSTGGLTFITQEAVSLTSPSFSPCRFSGTADVAAQQNGDKYNIPAGQSFTVAGYSKVTGTNSGAMTGGMSKIIKVVAQADLDDAKNKIVQKTQDEAKKNLFDQFQTASKQGIVETLSSGSPAIKSSTAVGAEAETVTVTADITYTMLGVSKDDLKQFIEADAKTRVDTNKQPIQDYGLDTLTFQLLESKTPTQARVTLDTEVIAGVKLDTDNLKEQIKGKKKGAVTELLSGQTGVTDVSVHYSPFWVTKAPQPSKITIIVEQTTPSNE